MRRTAPSLLGVPATVVLAALTAGLLAGCGADPVEGAGKARVEPRAWAATVCTAVRPWTTEVDRLQAAARAKTAAALPPEQTKRELVALFGGAEEASDTALRKVRTAGVPAVEEGRRISDQFVAALTAARDTFSKAKATVAALSTADRAAFFAGVSRAGAVMTKENAESTKGFGDLRDATLDKAFDDAPECR